MSDSKRYEEAGLDLHEWEGRPFCCDKCEMNHGRKVSPGTPFPSGDLEPPAHEGCTCCLLPVIPGFDA
jgi:hypothetical protein